MPLFLKHIYNIFSLIVLLSGSLSFSQTIGVLHNTQDASDGYTLFTPDKNKNVYLINNCGEVVNQWLFTERPGLTCYILENGHLLRAGKSYLEKRDWNNNLIWSFDMQAAGLEQHHDIEPLPNGNILCLLSRSYTSSEIIAEGKDPNFIDADFKIDELVELQPVGANDALIVWEWKFMDHFIQEYDNTKSNYGPVINHPELIDINYNSLTSDIIHLNSIDYNSVLDQIIMSARHMNEIYIIDHSTTTSEAAGHSGGVYGKGGDLLWRWGNPPAYKQGTVSDQKLYLQHDARWVTSGYLDQGKITVFNNGGDGSYTHSSVHIITPEVISGVYQTNNAMYMPSTFEWSWQGDILGVTVNEGRKSGTHALPNGNMMICETSEGRISEIKKDGSLVWSYKNPTGIGTTVYMQNEPHPDSNNIFRGDKYPPNYIGFSGLDMTATGIIENQNSISEDCINTLNVNSIELEQIIVINPVVGSDIIFKSPIVQLDTLTIFNLNGMMVKSFNNFNGVSLETNLSTGVYVLKLQKDKSIKYLKIIQK